MNRGTVPCVSEGDGRVEEVVRLRRAVSHLTRRLNATASDIGLTPSESSVLGSITTFGPLGVPELVEMEHINPSMLSRIVAKLDKAGLVERWPHPKDHRTVLLGPTPLGRERHAIVQTARAEIVFKGLARLTDTEQQAVLSALTALEALSQAVYE